LAVVDGRRLRGQATRQRLLAAARRLFGERGYDATTIEAVLDAARVARGALYHHFDGKTELFDAVLQDVLAEIASETAAAAADSSGSDDPLDRLRAGSHAWLAMAVDPAIRRIALLDPQAVVGWTRWRALDEQYSLGGLRASLDRLAEERRIPEGQAELIAHILLAALNEAAIFIASADDPRAGAETARAAVDTLLDRLAGARDRRRVAPRS
jgi:AcrR family transcriptional regulator